MRWPFLKKQSIKDPVIQIPFNAGLKKNSILPEGNLDQYSETWVFIKNYCETRIMQLRQDNDNPNHDERKTAMIRGQIRELKNILELPKPKPVMYVDEE